MAITWWEAQAVAVDVLGPKVAELMDACDAEDAAAVSELAEELAFALEVVADVRV